VPKTHLGRLTCTIACVAGVLLLSLMVAALTTTTDFSVQEEQVFERIVSEQRVRDELRQDAGVLVKDFLALTRLKKRGTEYKRRSRLLLGLVGHAERFRTKRLAVFAREEDNEALLRRMQGQIDGTLTELREGVDSMRLLFENSKAVQDEQEEFRDHLRAVHANSVKLINFAQLLTDVGPIRPVRAIREVNGTSVISQEALAKEVLLTKKVALEAGDFSSGEEESVSSYKS